jgi:hypothetical protein
MTVTFEICALGSLPWPKALGKLAEYPGLEHQMRLLLGEHWADPLTNQRAFETSPEYRTIPTVNSRKPHSDAEPPGAHHFLI